MLAYSFLFKKTIKYFKTPNTRTTMVSRNKNQSTGGDTMRKRERERERERDSATQES